jgi:hypothetical protein
VASSTPITSNPSIFSYSPSSITADAAGNTRPNIVEQYYRDKAIAQATNSEKQDAQIEGAVVLGGSIVAVVAFLTMKPEHSLLLLFGEMVGFGIFKSVKESCKPQATPTVQPRVIHVDTEQ